MTSTANVFEAFVLLCIASRVLVSADASQRIVVFGDSLVENGVRQITIHAQQCPYDADRFVLFGI